MLALLIHRLFLLLGLSRLTLSCSFRNLLNLHLLCLSKLFWLRQLPHWFSLLLGMRVIDPSFKLIHNYLILLKLAVMVALVAYPMMLVRRAEVGTQLVDLLQWQFLSDLHLALLLAPFLIVQFYYTEVLKLQLLVLAPACLLLTVFLVIRVEVLLLILCEGILLRHAVDVEIAYLFDSLAEAADLHADLLAEFRHLELFFKFQLLIDLQHVLEVIVERCVFPLTEV